MLSNLIDEIWYQAGDKSTDVNWYIKRGLLTAVYNSTELFMLTDSSENFRETWEFLERRIDSMVSVNKIQQNVENNFGALGNVICSVLSSVLSQSQPPSQSQGPSQNSHDNTIKVSDENLVDGQKSKTL
eukprot:TRINITY_DN1385_c0_g2_i2.p2 TRINITY_DN1385_c0_g2~~TRINITY_DN1385_c0_g2_i2.p2  ORF type:complete len:129 (-),score=32.45 TRINITY_DN1385_c0_g2_i2:51-437(-)